MRKIWLLLGLSLLLVSLSACGDSEDKSENGSDTAQLASLRSENKSLKKELKSAKGTEIKTSTASTNSVDLLAKSNNIEGRVSKVTQQHMVNNEEDYTNAEYNIDGKVPDKYYKATISFSIKNLGDKEIDLSYGDITLTDATNQIFSQSSSDHNLFTNSNDVIQPQATVDNKLELISENKIDLSKFKVNFSQGLMDSNGAEIQSPFSLEYTNNK